MWFGRTCAIDIIVNRELSIRIGKNWLILSEIDKDRYRKKVTIQRLSIFIKVINVMRAGFFFFFGACQMSELAGRTVHWAKYPYPPPRPAPPRPVPSRPRLRTYIFPGFVQSLEFLKKSWNLPSVHFPVLQKVWKVELKSGKMLKSFEFYSKLQQAGFMCNFFFCNFFSFWSNLIQFRPYVCSGP